MGSAEACKRTGSSSHWKLLLEVSEQPEAVTLMEGEMGEEGACETAADQSADNLLEAEESLTDV